MSQCDAKIRPLPNDTEMVCEDDHVEVGPDIQHHATLRDYAYPGSTTRVTWNESDRRNFRGEWAPCPTTGCTLPAGHHGRDAF